MDQEPAAIDATEEVEESTKVSADHDQERLQTPRGSQGLDQNEQMAVCEPQSSTFRSGPEMVQEAGTHIFK